MVAVAAITQAELDANCKVPASTSTPLQWNIRTGQVTGDGTPIVHYALENNSTLFTQGVYFSIWNGTGWESGEVMDSLWPGELQYKNEGPMGRVQFTIPYSDSKWDVGVSFIPRGQANHVNNGDMVYSGWLTGDIEVGDGHAFCGQRYCVMPASEGETGKFGGAATGAILNGLGTYTAGVENPVKAVNLGFKILRTADTGATWQTVKEIESLGPYGLTRASCYNAHFLDDDKFFFLIGDCTTTDYEMPDSSDVMMIYENLYNRSV